MRKWLSFIIAMALVMQVSVIAPVHAADAAISTAAIAGVTAPVTGATPVTAATATVQYTATVTWSPADAQFVADTAYTATITLTPTTGYTLTGVATNFFTVAGAAATNAINAGVVTALFPATTGGATFVITTGADKIVKPIYGASYKGLEDIIRVELEANVSKAIKDLGLISLAAYVGSDVAWYHRFDEDGNEGNSLNVWESELITVGKKTIETVLSGTAMPKIDKNGTPYLTWNDYLYTAGLSDKTVSTIFCPNVFSAMMHYDGTSVSLDYWWDEFDHMVSELATKGISVDIVQLAAESDITGNEGLFPHDKDSDGSQYMIDICNLLIPGIQSRLPNALLTGDISASSSSWNTAVANISGIGAMRNYIQLRDTSTTYPAMRDVINTDIQLQVDKFKTDFPGKSMVLTQMAVKGTNPYSSKLASGLYVAEQYMKLANINLSENDLIPSAMFMNLRKLFEKDGYACTPLYYGLYSVKDIWGGTARGSAVTGTDLVTFVSQKSDGYHAVILNPTSTAVIIDNVVVNGSVKLDYTVSGFKGSTGSIEDTTVSTFDTLANGMPAYSCASVFIPNLAGAPTVAMTEENLNAAVVNLTLTSGDTFKDNTLDVSNFTLNDAPAGTSVEAVIYTDATHANVLLAFNGTDFDVDAATFTITVAGAELANNITLTTGNMTITANSTAITAIAAISGTAKAGVELTAGALTPLAATVSYRWQICDTAGGTYTDIALATTNKYTPVAGDANKYIKVVATGTGSYFSIVTSAETAAVAPPVPITAIGAIAGTAQVGVELTAGVLTSADATASYKWQICDTAVGTYTNISGATTNKYTPVAGDVAKFIKVAATGTGSYSGIVTSTETAVVAPPIPITIAEISGTAQVGVELTAGVLTPENATVSYRWQICSTEDGTYTNIMKTFALTNKYKPIADDIGKFIKVVATGTGGYGTITSAATVAVAAASITAIGAIAGTAQVGVELTAGALIPAVATASYQWQICAIADGTYADIAGATTNKYIPVASDIAKFIKVVATGTGTYSGVVTSAATAVVTGDGDVGGSPTTVTPPTIVAIATDGNTTTVSTVVKATTDSATGTATAKVEASAFNALADKAKEAETSGQKAVVEIKVEVATNTKSVVVEIPRGAFNKVAEGTKADVKVDAGIGTVTFNAKVVESISGAANAGNIFISITKVEASTLTSEVQAKVGDRPVFEFSVKAGSTEISNFGGGNAEISIPYTPKPGEKKNSIVVYYIDNTGKLKTVRGKYDTATETVNFKTSHFSLFAVGYNEVIFNDVAADIWYNEAVSFMSARGIVIGVGDGKFAPENNATRADFLIMVMNSYGIEIDTTITDNFGDAGNKYYTKYLGTAKRLGLVFGVGENKYAPEATISRQDMFVILYRALDKLGELPTGTSGKSLGSFNDAGDIAGYANDTMKLFAETGTIVGDGNNLTPKGTSTRAQAAQVLYNLLTK